MITSKTKKNGSVQVRYGYVDVAGKKIWGWTVVSHKYRNTSYRHYSAGPGTQSIPSSNRLTTSSAISTYSAAAAANDDPDDTGEWEFNQADTDEDDNFPIDETGPTDDPTGPDGTGGGVSGSETWAFNFGVSGAAATTSNMLGDVNGDERADAVAYNSGTWTVALSNGSSFVPQPAPWRTGFGSGTDRRFVADVDGDGLADAITFYRNLGSWNVALSTGSGFAAPTAWVPNGFAGGSDNTFVGDVTGDGKADAVAFYNNRPGLTPGSWMVARSTGSIFQGDGIWGAGHGLGSNRQMLADTNGDGKLDPVVYFGAGSGSWYVSLSTGASFLNYSPLTTGFGSNTSGLMNVLMADVNGDGFDDAILYYFPGTWYVSLSDGQTLTGQILWATGVGSSEALGLADDVNGDHQADVTAVAYDSNNWVVGRAIDTRPPDTQIDSGPGEDTASAISTIADPTFTFSSPERYVSFECQIDSGTYTACASPFHLTPLLDGQHMLSVRAVDGGGNPDPSPATRSFSIDATPPETTISSPQNPGLSLGISNMQATGDFNGDGLDDVMDASATGVLSVYAANSNGGFTTTPQTVSDLPEGPTVRTLADVNGDGKADVVAGYTGGKWVVALSNGSGFGAASEFTTEFHWGNGSSFAQDVNGDGKADAVVFGTDGRWRVALSTGSSFSAWAVWATGTGVGSTAQMMGDVDGDHRADAVYFISGSWYVAKSTGSAFGAASVWRTGFGSGSLGQSVADVTGDGKVDAVAYFSGSTTWFVAPSTGTAFLGSAGDDVPWLTEFGGGARVKLFGDFNGDDKADIAANFASSGGQLQLAIATGGSFDAKSQAYAGDTRGFNVNSSDLTVHFECSLDGAAYASCGSLLTTQALSSGSHTVTARAIDEAGNVDLTPASITFTVSPPIRINYQPAASPTYSGYMVDGGSPYAARGNGYTYGWKSGSSGADLSASTRDRNAANSLDQRYDTLITLEYVTSAYWEIDLPNGVYTVHLVAGDPSYTTGVYKFAVEGTTVVDGTPTTTNPWIEGTASVWVSDGKLTVTSVAGASANKINYIEITPH
ncbi:MAG TPA: VCBS repeat-containing protein [Solirubrobacterales bacterium]|nr:VCBS repeat-containing protein [Solirubrobacterales bacterium]